MTLQLSIKTESTSIIFLLKIFIIIFFSVNELHELSILELDRRDHLKMRADGYIKEKKKELNVIEEDQSTCGSLACIPNDKKRCDKEDCT